MPVKRIKRKIEHLREQPEPVRMRAAALMTVVSGGVIALLWLTVLLPIQLGNTGGDKGDQTYPEDVLVEAGQGFGDDGQALVSEDSAGEVSGIRDEGDDFFRWDEAEVWMPTYGTEPELDFGVSEEEYAEELLPTPTGIADGTEERETVVETKSVEISGE